MELGRPDEALAVAEELVKDLSDEEVYRIMRGNAIAMLGLEGP